MYDSTAAPRILAILWSLACFLAAIANGLEIIESPSEVQQGKYYTITFTPIDDTPTTVNLLKGPSVNAVTIAELTTTATRGTFIWKVGSDLPIGDDYGLGIQRGDEVNYKWPISYLASPTEPSTSPSGINTSNPTASASVNYGLNTGEKVGIGIGAAIGGLILIFVAFWLGLSVNRRKIKSSDAEVAKSLDHRMDSKESLGELHGETIPAELDAHDRASTPQELAAPLRMAPELDGQQLHELPHSHPSENPEKSEKSEKSMDSGPREL